MLPILLVAALVAPQDQPQFVEAAETLPGPEVWSEAIVTLDVNRDGKLDLLFINAQGFAAPGDFRMKSADPLAPTLLINTSSGPGRPSFEDRTAAYLPADFRVHGKGGAAVDVDGDGFEDLVIAVAFGAQQRLLRFDPMASAANAGERPDLPEAPAHGRFFDESERLGELVLNGFGVAWGDVDADGDLDLAFADAGPETFGPPGAKPRLLLNDGSGNFEDMGERLGAVEKVAAQNAKLVDIDGDLDLDLVVDGKSPITQLYLNDGAGGFTLDLKSLPPTAWSLLDPPAEGELGPDGRPAMDWNKQLGHVGTYENEWADMDGDLDIDAMFMNFSIAGGRPYASAVIENLGADGEGLSFTAHTDALVGANAEDRNDFCFLDADDDGDLDVIVGVLMTKIGNEKLFINQGSLGTGSLVQRVGAFSERTDGTLDMAVADFDGDGRYDVVTAQGESRRPSFHNRYYANTGPKDSHAPVIGRVSELPARLDPAAVQDGLMLRAWIQDAVVDDGTSLVTATLALVLEGPTGKRAVRLAMAHVGGGIYQADLAPALLGSFATGPGAAGEVIVDFAVQASDPVGNVASTTVRRLVVE